VNIKRSFSSESRPNLFLSRNCNLNLSLSYQLYNNGIKCIATGTGMTDMKIEENNQKQLNIELTTKISRHPDLEKHKQGYVLIQPSFKWIRTNEELSDIGKHVVFGIDISGSMNADFGYDSINHRSTRLKQLKESIEQFIENNLQGKNDTISIVPFDSEATVLKNLDGKTALVELEKLKSNGGGTDIAKALLAISKLMEEHSNDLKKTTIFFATDGKDNALDSTFFPKTRAWLIKKIDKYFPKSLRPAIFYVGIGSDYDMEMIGQLATSSNQIPTDTTTSWKLSKFFTDAASLLREKSKVTITISSGNGQTPQEIDLGYTFSDEVYNKKIIECKINSSQKNINFVIDIDGKKTLFESQIDLSQLDFNQEMINQSYRHELTTIQLENIKIQTKIDMLNALLERPGISYTIRCEIKKSIQSYRSGDLVAQKSSLFSGLSLNLGSYSSCSVDDSCINSSVYSSELISKQSKSFTSEFIFNNKAKLGIDSKNQTWAVITPDTDFSLDDKSLGSKFLYVDADIDGRKIVQIDLDSEKIPNPFNISVLKKMPDNIKTLMDQVSQTFPKKNVPDTEGLLVNLSDLINKGTGDAQHHSVLTTLMLRKAMNTSSPYHKIKKGSLKLTRITSWDLNFHTVVTYCPENTKDIYLIDSFHQRMFNLNDVNDRQEALEFYKRDGLEGGIEDYLFQLNLVEKNPISKISEKAAAKISTDQIEDYLEKNEIDNEQYICPIGGTLMLDPVVIHTGGKDRYFERDFLTKWVQDKETCPFTREKITTDNIQDADPKVIQNIWTLMKTIEQAVAINPVGLIPDELIQKNPLITQRTDKDIQQKIQEFEISSSVNKEDGIKIKEKPVKKLKKEHSLECKLVCTLDNDLSLPDYKFNVAFEALQTYKNRGYYGNAILSETTRLKKLGHDMSLLTDVLRDTKDRMEHPKDAEIQNKYHETMKKVNDQPSPAWRILGTVMLMLAVLMIITAILFLVLPEPTTTTKITAASLFAGGVITGVCGIGFFSSGKRARDPLLQKMQQFESLPISIDQNKI
jgi:hypothetical protein